MARWTNLALLVLVPLAVASGLVINLVGSDIVIDPRFVHGVIGLAVVGLTPWKSVVVRRGFRSLALGKTVSVTLLALIAVTVASGVALTLGLLDRVGPLTLMQVHVGGGLIALLGLVAHYRMRPVRARSADLGRRAALRAGLLTMGATVAWLGWEGALNALDAPGADRRHTGSHERGSFDPSAMPVTSWLDDTPPSITPDEWRLDVAGNIYTLDRLAGLPQSRLVATLDCTSGWYSEQAWRGVRLDHLLAAADWESFEVRSATGYTRRYPIEDLTRTWLALVVGGEPLSTGHGFPARLVSPGRRGFWWVKWVVSITPSNRPAWLQSPFPLT
jgi:hypothetical protein